MKTLHGEVWGPICEVTVLNRAQERVRHFEIYRLVSPGQEWLSIHSFNSLRETMMISPLPYQSGGNVLTSKISLLLRCLSPIDDPIQPRPVLVLTPPP